MSFVTYEPQGAVADLIINPPEALNPLNTQVTRRSTPLTSTPSAA